MAEFIRLTKLSGTECWVNVDKIATLGPGQGSTSVLVLDFCTRMEHVGIIQNPAEVLARIRAATAQRRLDDA